jgi:hypothetical protein
MENFEKDERTGKLVIQSVNDLVFLSKSPELWEKHFVQKARINMAGIEFTPIGNIESPFNGSFDGNGYEIYNLNINCPDGQGVGLFGSCDEKANIQSVQLHNCNIVGADGVGGICGLNQGGRIEYCEVYGTIKATEYFDAVGCIVGANCDGGIVDMHSVKVKIITDKEISIDSEVDEDFSYMGDDADADK